MPCVDGLLHAEIKTSLLLRSMYAAGSMNAALRVPLAHSSLNTAKAELWYLCNPYTSVLPESHVNA